MITLRESSKQNWKSNTSTEHINAGSLQRMADAAERMADAAERMASALSGFTGYVQRLERENRALRTRVRNLRTKK